MSWLAKVRARLAGVPYEIRHVNLFADWYLARGKTEDRKYLAPYYDEEGHYVRYEVGDLAPMLRTKKGIAHYRVTKRVKWASAMSDLLMSDDGMELDFEFVSEWRVRER